MPVYVYKCDVCGTTEDHIRRVADRNDLPPCPACTHDTKHYPGGNFMEEVPDVQRMQRDITAEGGHTDTGYQNEILSEALGIDPSQISEAKKRFPHHNFAPDGRMILTSHGERKRVLRELGFRDWDSYTG